MLYTSQVDVRQKHHAFEFKPRHKAPWNVRLAKTRVSLHNCAIWSEFSLGALCQSVFMRTAKTLIRMRDCASWSEAFLFLFVVCTCVLLHFCMPWLVPDNDKQLETIGQTHDKTNKMTCAPSEDSDQPVHPPSLIRVFPVRSIGS